MSLPSKAAAAINALLRLLGIEIVRKAEIGGLREERRRYYRPSYNAAPLPEGAEEYLQSDNPRLLEIKKKYQTINIPATEHTQWTDEYVDRELNLTCFRGDNPFLFQYRDKNEELNYILTAYYIQLNDHLNLLDRISEDGQFGVFTFPIDDNLLVSRDLLDSISEINFLEETLHVSAKDDLTVLDIGAGYGRFAHRLVRALPNLGHVLCVDAIAESTFLSEFYLRFRGVEKKATVVPLYDIEKVMSEHSIDLATNIHSFSECSISAIAWWLDLLQNFRVRYLMVVPNPGEHGGTRLLSIEKDMRRLDFLPAIETRGYTLISKQPKYKDSCVQKYGVTPTYYYLFELSVLDPHA